MRIKTESTNHFSEIQDLAQLPSDTPPHLIVVKQEKTKESVGGKPWRRSNAGWPNKWEKRSNISREKVKES